MTRPSLGANIFVTPNQQCLQPPPLLLDGQDGIAIINLQACLSLLLSLISKPAQVAHAYLQSFAQISILEAPTLPYKYCIPTLSVSSPVVLFPIVTPAPSAERRDQP
jgi:hypothetical protein